MFLQGVGYYESKSEADMRYECFKQSVDEVNEVNSQNLSWIAGILAQFRLLSFYYSLELL